MLNTTLTTSELEISKKLINKGLSKAAESLTFFIREKIKLNSADMHVVPFSEITHLAKRNYGKGFILITEMMGELNGVCYLIFNEEEADKLFKVSLPKEILENEDKFKMMSEAILLEVDNIITGSVVTQFSNVLGSKMFGGVPRLEIKEGNEVNDYIMKKPNKDSFIIQFKAEFHSESQDFSPEFIWFMDNSFIQGIKNVSEDSAKLQLLN